jgi:small-conductance mechanosensitive channel
MTTSDDQNLQQALQLRHTPPDLAVHRAGADFDFAAYMGRSMEDDSSSLVGLGLPMWIFLIVFVLLSAVWGARMRPCPINTLLDNLPETLNTTCIKLASFNITGLSLLVFVLLLAGWGARASII